MVQNLNIEVSHFPSPRKPSGLAGMRESETPKDPILDHNTNPYGKIILTIGKKEKSSKRLKFESWPLKAGGGGVTYVGGLV